MKKFAAKQENLFIFVMTCLYCVVELQAQLSIGSLFNFSYPNPSKDTAFFNTKINISSNDLEKLFTSQESSIYDEAVIQGLRKQFLPCRLEQNFIPMYNQSLGKDPCSTLHEVCRRPIRIIFTESPPLIFTGPSSDKVKGILPRM